jgi:hypothetical protein
MSDTEDRRVDRLRPLKIYVSEADRDRISAGAAACAMTVSMYVGRLATGYEPKSKVDGRAFLELVKLRADLGRLGGLLKLRLKDIEDPATEALLAEIASAQAYILKKVDEL